MTATVAPDALQQTGNRPSLSHGDSGKYQGHILDVVTVSNHRRQYPHNQSSTM